MKLISPSLEQDLLREESAPINILDARKALEEALIYQFRMLGNGLFAHFILQGSEIGKLKWWYHYLSQMDDVPTVYYPDYENPAFNTFCKHFLQEVATGQTKPLTPIDLNSMQIRIFGDNVYLWNDVRINAQLAYLGSSLRLVFVGSRNLALSYIQAILGKEVDRFKVDTRFIFGSVAPLTATPIAPVLDFEKEYAISPFLADRGGGFNYERRIAIRRVVIKIGVEDSLSDKPGILDKISISDSDKPEISAREFFNQGGFQELFEASWLMALLHEMGHGIPDFGYSYLRAFWRDDIKNDICRFTQSPRSIQEIRETMRWGFTYPGEELMAKYSKEIPPTEPLPTLETILKEMKAENLIVETSGRKLHCPLYRIGKKWTPQ